MPDTHDILTTEPAEKDEQKRDKKVLRARPVKGPVDHAALSREFMARFPKIRAALAK
jgi:hypothetical protein